MLFDLCGAFEGEVLESARTVQSKKVGFILLSRKHSGATPSHTFSDPNRARTRRSCAEWVLSSFSELGGSSGRFDWTWGSLSSRGTRRDGDHRRRDRDNLESNRLEWTRKRRRSKGAGSTGWLTELQGSRALVSPWGWTARSRSRRRLLGREAFWSREWPAKEVGSSWNVGLKSRFGLENSASRSSLATPPRG